jgi:L-alanine-DL-glutamate epimerase-like enolase superfamily enzyme
VRIASVEAMAVEIPLARNFGGSTYAVLKRCAIVTRLRTDDGLVSEIYNGDNRERGGEIVRLIEEAFAPRLRGRSILDGERIWDDLFTLSHASRDRKTLMEAIACVDCAIWDVVGKAQGRSVSALLGGGRARLPIISIGGYYREGRTHADLGREMEAYRKAGMAGCKFKVGGMTPEDDAKRVEAARAAAGRDFVLMVDANRGWSVEEAVRFARLVEPLEIRWFEEPCHWHDDAAMMGHVRQATPIPVAAGQSEITSHGVRRLLEAGAVDVVNVDASECGGVTEWRRAAALCDAAGVEMGHHEESQVAQHLMAAAPRGTYVECFADPDRDPIWQTMWANRPAIEDGMMDVATGPGFGVVLDDRMIQRYRSH